MIKTFLMAYFQLLLLSVMSRLTNREQYTGMIVCNVIVGILYCLMFRHLMMNIDQWDTILAYVLGTSLGSISGVWGHHKWSKK